MECVYLVLIDLKKKKAKTAGDLATFDDRFALCFSKQHLYIVEK
jgi:hypothetical protein